MKKAFIRICAYVITALTAALILGAANSAVTPETALTSVIYGTEPTQAPSGNDISAASAVVIEAESGKVVWGKSIDRQLPMASTTKIMTAWLTLRQEGLDDTFKVDSGAIAVEGSSMGLRSGDIVSLRALATGMLTVSGNDAANAAAVRISGTVKKFASLMNETAVSIGMTNTSFVTPSGLDAAGHYSTAYDMALLASHALKCDDFLNICSANSSLATYGNPPYLRSLINGNRLLRSYEGAIGVKTGYTSSAGRCLVSAAERNGVRLICVTLKAPDDWSDHQKLLDYGFSAVQRLELAPEQTVYEIPVAGTTQTVTALPAGNAQVSCLYNESGLIETRVNVPKFTYLPVSDGQELGSIEYVYNDKVIAKIPLIAAYGVTEAAEKQGFFDKLADFFSVRKG